MSEPDEDRAQRPLQVVEAVFRRMVARYGSDWMHKWAAVDIEDVKRDWAMVIGHFSRDSIAYGLRFLPEKPPTSTQFAAVCQRAPLPEVKRLARPKADPEKVADVVIAVKAALGGAGADPLAGARHLRQREEAGERLTMAQRAFWRAALKREINMEFSE